MCKLCGTDRLYTNNTTCGATTEKSLHFIKACNDYFNENPCNICIKRYRTHLKTAIKTKDIDDYITRKLIYTYSNKINIGMKRSRLFGKYELKDYMPRSKTIEQNISKLIIEKTGHVSYRVEMSINSKKISKFFNTLSEAKKFKSLQQEKIKPAKGYHPIKKTVETYICKHSNTSNNNIYFSFQKGRNEKQNYKSFKTLKEAQQYKQEILNDNINT